MTEYAYHCSSEGGIEEFEPKVSSHGKAYVYATPNKSLALVFGVKGHNDFWVHPSYNYKDNTCVFTEMSPNALDKYYRGKSAYLYTVNKDEFTECTGWKGEICSPNPVKPLKVEYIEDLGQAILKEQKTGHLTFIPFEERNNQGMNMDEYFAKRELFYMLRNNNDEYTQGCISYIKNLENKNVYHKIKEYLKCYLDNFTNKQEHSSSSSIYPIIPQDIIEKYKTDASDGAICHIFYNLNDLSLQNIPQAISEIKEINNKELTQKIIFRLTKLNNVVKEIDTKTPIVQSKTMD